MDDQHDQHGSDQRRSPKPVEPLPTAGTGSPQLTNKPGGTLTVVLYEASGLSVPSQYQELFQDIDHEIEESKRARFAFYLRDYKPYAIVNYAHSQLCVPSTSLTRSNFFWGEDGTACKIDAPHAAKLNIHLYARYTRACRRGRSAFLGMVSLDPLEEQIGLGSRWLDVQLGTGQLRVSVEYVPNADASFECDLIRKINRESRVSLGRKKDTKQLYANKSVRRTETFCFSPGARSIHHPCVIYLAFAAQSVIEFAGQSIRRLNFYTPFVSGGHLFIHLQRTQRFDIDRSRVYAAEIISALDYLHSRNMRGWLKAANVMLDALGYVTLCGFGLFRHRDPTKEHWKRPEYPAPEVLLEAKYTEAADWWTLGILLNEMLTGLPPFYSEVPEDIRDNIIGKQLHLHEALDAPAKDILNRLLERDPKARLGANGALEVKQHIFFQGLDWEGILQRTWEPAFQPGYCCSAFESYGVDSPSDAYQFVGLEEKRSMAEAGTLPVSETHSGSENKRIESIWLGAEPRIPKDEDWEVLWAPATNELHFLNTRTGSREKVAVKEGLDALAAKAEGRTLEVRNLPSPEQIRAALKTALELGRESAVAQLLEFNIDLSIPIFRHQTTAIEWTVSHGNLDLLETFLSKIEVNGPDRVAATRALGLAIRLLDIRAAEILVRHGTHCDFEEGDRDGGDRPLLGDPSARVECTLGDDSLDGMEFTPPLVSAVTHGNTRLVQMLLAHGANPNVGYHEISCSEPRKHAAMACVDGTKEFPWGSWGCGRVIQLAMYLRLFKISALLIDHGADIELPAPVWDVHWHECDPIPRAVYHRVTAALRQVRATSLGL